MAQRVQIVIEANADAAQKVIDKINANLGNIGSAAFKQQLDGVNKLSEGMLRVVQITDQMVRTGYRLTLGLSAPLIAAISYAVKLGSTLESARISFEILTGSVANATKHLQELQTFAATTPFQFTQLIGLSRQLQAAGIAAKDVIPLLRSVGNTLAVIGGDPEAINRIIDQLVHIQTLGRVTLRELNPIARAGIPVFAQLADAIKLPGEAADETGRRLKRLIAGGILPGPEFIKFFQAAQNVQYPQGLEKISQTIKTQISNLVDVFQFAAAQLGEALAPATLVILAFLTNIVKILSGVISVFNQLPNPIKIAIGLFIAFAAAIGPITLGVGYLVRSIASVFQLLKQFSTFLSSVIGTNTAQIASINAVTSAEVKEAVAISATTEAIVAQTVAIKANNAIQATQLPLFNAAPYARNAQGKFLKNVVPPPLPVKQQLSLFEETAPAITVTAANATASFAASEINSLSGKIQTQLGQAFESASANIAGLTTGTSALGIQLANLGSKFISLVPYISVIIAALVQLTRVFLKLGEVLPNITAFTANLEKLGVSFQTVKDIANTFVDGIVSKLPALSTLSPIFNEAYVAIKHAIDPLSGFLDYIDQINAALTIANDALTRLVDSGASFIPKGIQDYIANQQKSRDTDAEDKRKKALEEYNIQKQLFNAAIQKNEAEQAYAELLDKTFQSERQARESSLEAISKQKGGLVGLNFELQKYLDKLTTETKKFPGEELPREVNVPLTPRASQYIATQYLADIQALNNKAQEELAQNSIKVDEEVSKTKLAQLDIYSKARIDRLQILGAAELLSIHDVEQQKAAIESSTADARLAVQLNDIDLEKQKRLSVLDIQRQQIASVTDLAKQSVRITQTQANPLGNIQQASLLFADALKYRNQLASANDAERDVAEHLASEKSKAITYETELAKYNIEAEFTRLRIIALKDLSDKQKDGAYEAATKALDFQKQSIAARKQQESDLLDFIQPISVKQTLEIEKQRLAIQEDSLRQQYEVAKTANQLRTDDQLRKQEDAFKKGVLQKNEYEAKLTQTTALGADEQKQILDKYYNDVAEAQRKAALEQIKIIRDSTLSVFDTARKSFDSILDQVLSRSKSIFGAITDAAKGALIGVAKNIISTALATQVTKLTTGQKVTLQESYSGNGPLSGIGGFLSRFAYGKPIVANPITTNIPISSGTSPQQADILATSRLNEYAQIVASEPNLPSAPKIPVAPEGLASSTFLKILQDKFGGDIGTVKLDDGAIPVSIQKISEAATVYEALTKGKKPELISGDEDTAELVRHLKALSDAPDFTAALKSFTDHQDELEKAHKLLNQPFTREAAPSVQSLQDAYTNLTEFLRTKHSNISPALIQGLDEFITKQENFNPDYKNPGALHFANQPGATPVTITQGGVDSIFAKFDTLASGRLALDKQIEGQIAKGQTAREFFQQYAPASDKASIALGNLNQPDKYATAAATALGISPDVPLSTYLNKVTPVAPATQVVPPVPTSGFFDFIKSKLPPGFSDFFSGTQLQGAHQEAKISNEELSKLEAIKSAIKEVLHLSDGRSPFTNTPVYKYAPNDPRFQGLLGNYDNSAGIIQLSSQAGQDTLLHEDTHALLFKQKIEDTTALNKLLPASSVLKANDILEANYDSYKDAVTRANEIIPRLVSGEGATLGLTQKETNEAVTQLVSNLQLQNKKELADKLSSIFKVGSRLSYGTPDKPEKPIDESIATALGLHDEARQATTASTQSQSSGVSNLPAILTGLTGGAYGGIATGAIAGALAGVPRLFIKTGVEKVKQLIKQLYGLEVDLKFAQQITDIINNKFKGNIQLGLRSQEVIALLRDYAAGTKQVFGSHSNSLPFGKKLGDIVHNLLPATISGITSLAGIFRPSPVIQNAQDTAQVAPEAISQLNSGGNFGPALGGDTGTLASSFGSKIFNIPGLSGNAAQLLNTSPEQSGLSDSIFNAVSGDGYSNIQLPNDLPSGRGQTVSQPISQIPGVPGLGVTKSGELATVTGQDGSGGVVGVALGAGASIAKIALGSKVKSAVPGILGSVGLSLVGLGLSSKNRSPIGSAVETSIGGAALGYSLAKSFPKLFTGALGGIKGPAGGVVAGLGLGLLAAGVNTGGTLGRVEAIGGGAAAGYAIGGPIGAGIGALVGLVASFFKTGPQKVQEQAKALYGLNLDRQFANQVFEIIKQSFAGNVTVGIRSKQVLDLLGLYAQATGQNFGIQNKARATNLIQTSTGLTQQAIYENGKALSFAGLSVYGGVATQQIQAPQHYATGGIVPFQQLATTPFLLAPSNNIPTVSSGTSSNAGIPPTIVVQNSLPESAVGDYLNGKTVSTILNSPGPVTDSQVSAYGSNINRREATRLQLRPSEVLT